MDTLQQSPPAEPEGGLRRNLKKRHLLMMSLGGTIGTGLFIGIAEPLSSVGPAGTLLAYLFAGTIMLATMMCLGELSCAFPHSGSFQHYALMFMPSPCWSYTIGWLYWFSWVFFLGGRPHCRRVYCSPVFPRGSGIYVLHGDSAHPDGHQSHLRKKFWRMRILAFGH